VRRTAGEDDNRDLVPQERSRRRGGRWAAGAGGEEDAGQQEMGEAQGRRRAARTAARVAARAILEPKRVAPSLPRSVARREFLLFLFFRCKKGMLRMR
jgi:hypothetical protein